MKNNDLLCCFPNAFKLALYNLVQSYRFLSLFIYVCIFISVYLGNENLKQCLGFPFKERKPIHFQTVRLKESIVDMPK